MKKYLHIIVLVATAIMLFACQKNASTDIVPAKQFTIVKSDLALSPSGGSCTIEVQATQAVIVTADREWCTATVSNKIVTVSAEPNYSLESRYCRLKLESGGEVLYATVQQYGEVVAGLEELSDLTAPVEGREIEVKIKTNVAVEAVTEESWIHVTLEDNKFIVSIDPNDEPRTRFGTVTYSAGSVSGSFEVTQYPELVKPESWVITEGTPTFDYPKFNTTASLSAGEEDMYVLRLIPKASVEGNIDDWVFDNLAVQVRNEILAKVEAAPETAFKDYLTTGTDAVTFDDIKPGDFYVVALGFGENSYVSGRYQYKAVTVDDIRPAYYKWAGKWTITGNKVPYSGATSTGSEEWTISVDEEALEQSLIVEGINSISHPTVLEANGATFKLTYNSADGSISLKSQKGVGFEYSTYGVSNMMPQGLYTKNGSSYSRVSSVGYEIFKASMAEDGTVTITPGIRTSGGVDYNYAGFRLYLLGGNGSTYTLGSAYQSGVIPLPFEMTLAN